MTRRILTRAFSALFGLMLVGLVAVPGASATEEPTAPVETAVDEPAGPQPAVVIDDASTAIEEQAWTFRYLVPTVLALAVVVVVLTLVVYGVRIRGRYRVVR